MWLFVRKLVLVFINPLSPVVHPVDKWNMHLVLFTFSKHAVYMWNHPFFTRIGSTAAIPNTTSCRSWCWIRGTTPKPCRWSRRRGPTPPSRGSRVGDVSPSGDTPCRRRAPTETASTGWTCGNSPEVPAGWKPTEAPPLPRGCRSPSSP